MEKEEQSIVSYFKGKITLFELGNSLMEKNEYFPAFSCFLKYAEQTNNIPEKTSESLYKASLSFINGMKTDKDSYVRNMPVAIDLCRYAINESHENWKSMLLLGSLLYDTYRFTDKWNEERNLMIDCLIRGISILHEKNLPLTIEYGKVLYIFRCLLDSCNEINYRLPDFVTSFIIKWIMDNYEKAGTDYSNGTNEIIMELPFFTDCHILYEFILKKMICYNQKDFKTFYCESDNDTVKELFLAAGKEEQRVDFLITPDIFVSFKISGMDVSDLLEYDFSINDFKEIIIYFNKETNIDNAIYFFTSLGYEIKNRMGTLLYFILKK